MTQETNHKEMKQSSETNAMVMGAWVVSLVFVSLDLQFLSIH